MKPSNKEQCPMEPKINIFWLAGSQRSVVEPVGNQRKSKSDCDEASQSSPHTDSVFREKKWESADWLVNRPAAQGALHLVWSSQREKRGKHPSGWWGWAVRWDHSNHFSPLSAGGYSGSLSSLSSMIGKVFSCLFFQRQKWKPALQISHTNQIKS